MAALYMKICLILLTPRKKKHLRSENAHTFTHTHKANSVNHCVFKLLKQSIIAPYFPRSPWSPGVFTNEFSRNDANGKWALIKAKKEIDFSIPPEYDPDDDDDDDDLSTHKHNSQHKNE